MRLPIEPIDPFRQWSARTTFPGLAGYATVKTIKSLTGVRGQNLSRHQFRE